MKTITSPVDRWPGSVDLKDPIPLADVVALERSIRDATAIAEGATLAEYYQVLLPGMARCISTWHLDGLPEHVTADEFPGTPRVESQKLLAWLSDEIIAIYRGDGGDAPPLA